MSGVQTDPIRELLWKSVKKARAEGWSSGRTRNELRLALLEIINEEYKTEKAKVNEMFPALPVRLLE